MLVTVAATAAVLIGAGQAAQALPPPANDTSSGAVDVSPLPFNTVETTLIATTDAEDAALNSNCGAPATEASVWFKYTPAADGTIVADVSASDYSAGLLAATGSPGSLVFAGCNPQQLVQDVVAGETVYLMAFDDTVGSGNGGQLTISVIEAPPPPDVSATINPVGRFNSRTGVATVSGSVTCTNGDFVDVQVALRQKVGRVAITGSGFTELPCDGTENWVIDVTGDNGRFGGGKVSAQVDAFSCGIVSCSDSGTSGVVSLKK